MIIHTYKILAMAWRGNVFSVSRNVPGIPATEYADPLWAEHERARVASELDLDPTVGDVRLVLVQREHQITGVQVAPHTSEVDCDTWDRYRVSFLGDWRPYWSDVMCGQPPEYRGRDAPTTVATTESHNLPPWLGPKELVLRLWSDIVEGRLLALTGDVEPLGG